MMTRLADRLLNSQLRARGLPLLLVWLIFWSAWTLADTPAMGMYLLAELAVLQIWQPVYPQGRAIGFFTVVQLLVAAALLFWLAGEPLLLLWATLVAGVLGGRAAGAADLATRWFHLILAILLQLIVWLLVVPQAAGIDGMAREKLLPVVIVGSLLAALLPLGKNGEDKRSSRSVLYGLVFLLLTLLVGVGAVALSRIALIPYLHAIAVTLVASGATLAAMIWLWNPHLGLGGIGSLAITHLLEDGSHFERWSAGLDARYVAESEPGRFLRGAVEDLLDLPGVVGIEWLCGGERQSLGKRNDHESGIRVGDLRIAFFTRRATTAAQRVQLELAARLLAHLYLAKVQASRQAEQAYLAAVHESGARLTHDIKNILQGLAGLVAAAASTRETDRLMGLYASQLPELARRLEQALAKLTRGGALQSVQAMPVEEWWRRLADRYAACHIAFAAGPAGGAEVDAVLFDCVADNLLQNAMQKRLQEDGLQIRAACRLSDKGIRFEVADDGSAIAAALVPRLGRAPLPSAHGMGIGILHASRLALERGYRLVLEENATGAVRFVLENRQGDSSR
ncbi:HAMP domain-containing histidine kinase [Chitinimonas arctica]|uniref:HAMP domain-containing histidine kinase n=1 Tax=Chitinimonas arctica TaxID=2594795 RepID=A0A516SE65_9NEIS|nr:HAMP domain-containing histidine kinase [Chitinimonas arctica]QDQ26400.1 HAMP domain-containing histidine kinase [Chitinimonas arctica]